MHTLLDTEQLGAVSLFSIDGVDSRFVDRELGEGHQIHVMHRQVGPLAGIRVSPHIYLLEDELDRFVEALVCVVTASR